MQLGRWQLDTVSGGDLWLDGGTMFGVVPKPLWQKALPCDERNRIRFRTNCVLARDGRMTILVDSGYGGKESARAREVMDLAAGEPLVASLAAKGVGVEDVDLVVFSHLHFDHAGGASRRFENGGLEVVFPRARFVAQRGEWRDAVSNAPELRSGYPQEHLAPLEASGRLDLIDGNVEIVPGVRSLLTPGHTRRHQAIVFGEGRETAAYTGDLCPTTAHLRSLWCMGYDAHLLVTRRAKPRFLGAAADGGWLVLWDHDPQVAACRLQRDAKLEFVPVDPLAEL